MPSVEWRFKFDYSNDSRNKIVDLECFLNKQTNEWKSINFHFILLITLNINKSLNHKPQAFNFFHEIWICIMNFIIEPYSHSLILGPAPYAFTKQFSFVASAENYVKTDPKTFATFLNVVCFVWILKKKKKYFLWKHSRFL